MALKTVEQFEAEFVDELAARRTGVACPECEAELLYAEGAAQYDCKPGQRVVVCSACPHTLVISVGRPVE